jgi:serine/threonine protein kinase
LILIKDILHSKEDETHKAMIFDEALSDLRIFCLKEENEIREKTFNLKMCDILFIIENILDTFKKLFELGIVYTDLKPANIVLVRYENKEDSEVTLYKNCY